MPNMGGSGRKLQCLKKTVDTIIYASSLILCGACVWWCVILPYDSNSKPANHPNLRVYKKNKPFFSLLFRMKQDAITYEFGDGGLHDNSGFLALVQRKASRVVPRWFARGFAPRLGGMKLLGSWEASGEVTVLFWCVWKVTVKRRGAKIDGYRLWINPPVSTCFFMNKAFRNRLDFWWVHKWGSIWRASVKVIGPAYPWDHAFILPCIMYPVY